MKHREDRENAARREKFHNLWRRLVEIETELQSHGNPFDLEDMQTLGPHLSS